jgi:uncharacterized protein YbjT (DUF2867 family)
MRTFLKLLGAVFLLLVIFVLAVIFSMRANIDVERFDLKAVSATAQTDGGYLLFGATRNTGLEIAKLLTDRGDRVTAFVRTTSDRSALEALGVDFKVGDALDIDTIHAAMEGENYWAVVSSIGCFGCERAPDFEGNRNIADAARAAGVERMVLISSIGAGDSDVASPFMQKMFLSDVLVLKTQAEEHLAASGLGYTIIRPGGLRSGPATGGGALSEDREAFGYIDRAELAQLVVAVLDDDRTSGHTFAAFDAQRQWIWD